MSGEPCDSSFKQSAFRIEPFGRAKLYSSMGYVTSQLEAPFSLPRSMALCSFGGRTSCSLRWRAHAWPMKPTSATEKASTKMRGHAPAGDTAPGHRPREDPAESLVVADDTRPATVDVLDAREHGPSQRPGRRDSLTDRGPGPREHPQ